MSPTASVAFMSHDNRLILHPPQAEEMDINDLKNCKLSAIYFETGVDDFTFEKCETSLSPQTLVIRNGEQKWREVTSLSPQEIDQYFAPLIRTTYLDRNLSIIENLSQIQAKLDEEVKASPDTGFKSLWNLIQSFVVGIPLRVVYHDIYREGEKEKNSLVTKLLKGHWECEQIETTKFEEELMKKYSPGSSNFCLHECDFKMGSFVISGRFAGVQYLILAKESSLNRLSYSTLRGLLSAK